MSTRVVAFGLLGVLSAFAFTSQAAVISCTGVAELSGPVAPVECFQESGHPGQQDNLAWILAQSVMLDGTSGIEKADKTGEGSTKPGYVLTLTDLGVVESADADKIITFGSEGYTHGFSVNGPDGTFLDYMVISWKQAGLLTGALFANVTLDVQGLLFSINANAKEADISHGSLHLALGTPPATSVPGPGSLALLGAGLLGLGLMRRKRRV